LRDRLIGARQDVPLVVGVGGGPPRRADDAGTIQYWPRWSPDGSRIVSAELEGANGVRDVVTMDADGTGQKVVVGNGDRPSWSPAGGSLVFASSGSIMVVNADGTQLHTLATGVGRAFWSPDGTQIAFQQARSRGVRVIRADGTSQTVTDAAVRPVNTNATTMAFISSSSISPIS